jgi:uncharacterized protein YbcI
MVLLRARGGARRYRPRGPGRGWFPTRRLSVSEDRPRLPGYRRHRWHGLNVDTAKWEMDEHVAAREHKAAMATTDRSPMLEISNAMVGLYKEAFGRGPTKARAQFAGPDTLVVILEASLTVAERNLVAMGEHQRLREARLFFQYALENQFRAIVEEALGRRTLAFVSGIDTRRDVAIEVFTLEPAAEDGASASDS